MKSKSFRPTSELKLPRAKALLSKFSRKKILVFGDVGLDQYTVGSVNRISPEAPIPIVDVAEVSYKLGLAANVADNISALKGTALLVGLVGDDATANIFRTILKKRHISDSYLVVDNHRPTTLKERVVAETQQVVRIDHESKAPITGVALEAAQDELLGLVKQAKCIIIEDYSKGLVRPDLCKKLVELGAKFRIPVLVDPNSRSSLETYRGCTLMTPNVAEAEALTGISITDHFSLCRAGQFLLSELISDYVMITRGKDGMAVFQRGHKEPWLLPTFAKEVYDVSGAGDTVIATLALGLVAGGDLFEAATLANYAAGVEVGKRGTATVTATEILHYMQSVNALKKLRLGK